MKILIIEDDEILERMYQKRLESEGYEVIWGRNGQEGIALAKTHQPDLILLDIMLPGGINGFDVLEQVKKHENLKASPVLILTNLGSEGKIAKDIGASGYLVKVNTKPEQVIAAVRQLLVNKKN